MTNPMTATLNHGSSARGTK